MKNVDIKPKLEIKVELDKDGMDEGMKHGIEVMKKPFQCNQCNYLGAQKDYLQSHVDIVHLKKCKTCGSCFSPGFELSKQMRWNCVKQCEIYKTILPCGHKLNFQLVGEPLGRKKYKK